MYFSSALIDEPKYAAVTYQSARNCLSRGLALVLPGQVSDVPRKEVRRTLPFSADSRHRRPPMGRERKSQADDPKHSRE